MSIEERVRIAIAEGLALQPEQVEAHHYLTDDLGAESLDYLDVVFRLEEAFGIQITRGEMEDAAKGDMADTEFAPEGVISDVGLERLRELLPESADRIQPGLKPGRILELFQVQPFVRIVERKLENT